ncbi:MAG: hypothetical protein QY307_05900 [Acidimicrobiia bacterium]|nr:MAG: hypothetical protein QY307_05900 [Acidimicrobiia bacterium]
MAERGAVHLTLLALLLGGMLMLGLAVDLARFAATWREASHLAATSAEAGAGWIDETAARRGELEVDATRSRVAATQVASGSGRSVLISVTPARVCVRVSIPVHPTLLAMVGAAPRQASAVACAEPRRG